MPTYEDLKSYKSKINQLIQENIESIPDNACVNKVDFKCNSIKYWIDDNGDEGYTAIFDESSPDCHITKQWLHNLLKQNNFIGFESVLEW